MSLVAARKLTASTRRLNNQKEENLPPSRWLVIDNVINKDSRVNESKL